MTETSEATCATCPWWQQWDGENSRPHQGECHHVSANGDESKFRHSDWWCSEHPDRKLPDVHEVAKIAMAACILSEREHDAEMMRLYGIERTVAIAAYDYADAMLAEAKRRKGE